MRPQRHTTLVQAKAVEHANRRVEVLLHTERLRVDHCLKSAAMDKAHGDGGDAIWGAAGEFSRCVLGASTGRGSAGCDRVRCSANRFAVALEPCAHFPPNGGIADSQCPILEKESKMTR